MGSEIELIHGQQGGYHLEIALLASGLDGDDLISGELRALQDGELKGSTTPWFDMACTSDGLESAGTFLIFDDGVLPEDLVDRPITVEATISDLDGNTADGTATVTIIDTVDENPE